MKTYLLISTLALWCVLSYAQSDSLAVLEGKVDSISSTMEHVYAKVDSNATAIAALSKQIPKTKSDKEECNLRCPKKACIGTWEWLLIFSPICLVLFMLIYIKRILSSSNYPISEALQEVTILPKTVTTTNTDGVDETTTTAEINRGRSSSRLVLFLSGIAAMLLASAICSYYFYFSIVEGETPNIEDLTNVLLALGIGVAPYAVNKVSKALKS